MVEKYAVQINGTVVGRFHDHTEAHMFASQCVGSPMTDVALVEYTNVTKPRYMLVTDGSSGCLYVVDNVAKCVSDELDHDQIADLDLSDVHCDNQMSDAEFADFMRGQKILATQD